MAEIFAPFVLESLIKQITDEANLLSGVKNEVKLLQGHLGFMNAFLQNYARKHSENPIVKELVNQIRDVALRCEEAIDTYRAEAIKHGSREWFKKLFHFPGHAKRLHDIAEETRTIRETIESIKRNKEEFEIGKAESGFDAEAEAEQSLHRRRRNVEEDDVVGFTDHTTTLVNQLTDQRRSRREVISIFGMGGLGKTTLAKKIFNNTHVKNHFHCYAWVGVSQEYKMNRLLIDILKSINVSISDEINQMSDEQLKITVRDILKGNRYFVVMDDIWTTQVWDDIKGAFPDESNGSRILITSREKKVALVASPSTPYSLPFLDKGKSWELLCKKVFQGDQCPPNLESLGRELAENCKGLPLSIVVLGGILANKEKSQEIWSRFVGCVRSYITDDRTPCLDILALSYDHLPLKLKPCFLYFGMFPEDYEIQTQELIKLWKAERLVQQIGNIKVDSVAEDYLEELIDRSLIQVAIRRRDGTVKACRIHDLLRDLCIKKSEKERFFDVCSEGKLSSLGKPRRLSIHCDSVQFISRNACDHTSSARSLVFFCQEGGFNRKEWEWVWKNFKFIRVLTLMDAGLVDSFPREMEKLIFLRHLSIRDDMENAVSFNKIPDYICRLPYLETIDIQFGSRITSLGAATFNQKSIWRMKQLKHLNVFGGFRILPCDQNQRGNDIVNDTLWNLQVVHSIKVDKTSAHFISKSPNLTELTLYYDYSLKDTNEIEVADVLVSLENLQYLQRLELHYFDSYPRLEAFPSALTRITLFYSLVDSHLMKILGKLPYLRQLKVNGNANGKPLYLKIAGEFPQLQIFELYNKCIESLELERDAMPNLEHLVISKIITSGVREAVPDQLWLKKALRFVEIRTVFHLADHLRDKLRKLNCVIGERVVEEQDEFLRCWEFTMKNGCKVSLTGTDLIR